MPDCDNFWSNDPKLWGKPIKPVEVMFEVMFYTISVF